MASYPVGIGAGEIEELTLCPCCKRAFDEAERPPKLLACRHHFCLPCARSMQGGARLHCLYCWKPTDLPDGSIEALPTHGAVLALTRRLAVAALPPPHSPEPESTACAIHALPALWCVACAAPACRACAAHTPHAHMLRHPHEARAILTQDSRELIADVQRMTARIRDAQLRALDAATVLKARLETELVAPLRLPAPPQLNVPLAMAAAEHDKIRALHAETALQCRLEELARVATVPLDFDLVRRVLAGASSLDPQMASVRRDPLLTLANYCTALLYSQQFTRNPVENGVGPVGGLEAICSPAEAESAEVGAIAALPMSAHASPPAPAPLRQPSAFPLYFFDLEVNGAGFGRVVVEVRDDVAPRMARNFGVLAMRPVGRGYRSCAVFQCWENESVITGDFELNNGRGGRAACEEGYFPPDETRLSAGRGAVGMRRAQRRHDARGLVGSQFRIVLREMRGFTAIFAHVAEGLELVDALSRSGDGAGKPHSTILISNCGKLN